MKHKAYIEFRVYFNNNTNPEYIDEVADMLQDAIIDKISTIDGFTQDVTFEKVIDLNPEDE